MLCRLARRLPANLAALGLPALPAPWDRSGVYALADAAAWSRADVAVYIEAFMAALDLRRRAAVLKDRVAAAIMAQGDRPERN